MNRLYMSLKINSKQLQDTLTVKMLNISTDLPIYREPHRQRQWQCQ